MWLCSPSDLLCAPVLPLPASTLGLSAGVIFGLPFGALLVYIGSLLGAAGGFMLGRQAQHFSRMHACMIQQALDPELYPDGAHSEAQ